MQSTKTEGTHHESGKPDTQGKFLAVIKIFWHLSKLHLCVSTHVISLQHSHSLVNLNNLLETPNNRYPYFLLPEWFWPSHISNFGKGNRRLEIIANIEHFLCERAKHFKWIISFHLHIPEYMYGYYSNFIDKEFKFKEVK